MRERRSDGGSLRVLILHSRALIDFDRHGTTVTIDLLATCRARDSNVNTYEHTYIGS
jgi:hypothetical protein